MEDTMYHAQSRLRKLPLVFWMIAVFCMSAPACSKLTAVAIPQLTLPEPKLSQEGRDRSAVRRSDHQVAGIAVTSHQDAGRPSYQVLFRLRNEDPQEVLPEFGRLLVAPVDQDRFQF
jgi:hypothetical protein